MATETTRRIYELQVKLAQESLAQLKQLKQTTKELESGFGSLTDMVKGFGAGLLSAFSVGAVVAAVHQAISAVDELGAAAQRVGLGVEQFSALAYAAEQSDMAMADLEIGLKELQKTMVETGTKGADVLAALGIDKTKPQIEVLKDFAEAFKTIHDPALRTNALLEVFGKSGLKLRPLLEQGAIGIDELMRKARELGFVISEETNKAFSDLDNTIKDSKKSTSTLTRDLTMGLAPALTDVLKAFQGASKEGEAFKTIGEALGIALRIVGSAAAVIGAAFKQVITVWAALRDSAERLKNRDLAGVRDVLGKMNEDLDKNREQLLATQRAMWGVKPPIDAATEATDANSAANRNNDRAVRDALAGQEALKKAHQKRIDDVLALNKAIEDQIFRLEQVGNED